MGDITGLKIPKHIAIIMDGNGRWAKEKKRPRTYGHMVGAKTLEQTCEDADDLGVKYLTVYAFSTENWKRPQDEVDTIMDILREYLKNRAKKMNKQNMVFKVIGDRSMLAPDINEKINYTEELTKSNTGLVFVVAINYGGRDEILRGMKSAMQDYKENKFELDSFNEEMFANYLDTKDIPDPELLIRTSGEERLSNYLLWQMAYTEFYFPEINWPDFNKKELIKAIEKYNGRDRRFGGIAE